MEHNFTDFRNRLENEPNFRRPRTWPTDKWLIGMRKSIGMIIDLQCRAISQMQVALMLS